MHNQYADCHYQDTYADCQNMVIPHGKQLSIVCGLPSEHIANNAFKSPHHQFADNERVKSENPQQQNQGKGECKNPYVVHV